MVRPIRLKFVSGWLKLVFVSESSLVAVDPLIEKLKSRIRKVDFEILKAVRQQVYK